MRHFQHHPQVYSQPIRLTGYQRSPPLPPRTKVLPMFTLIKEKSPVTQCLQGFHHIRGDPDWIQTNDPKLRRFVLYSAELPGRYFRLKGALAAMKVPCLAKHPQTAAKVKKKWQGAKPFCLWGMGAKGWNAVGRW